MTAPFNVRHYVIDFDKPPREVAAKTQAIAPVLEEIGREAEARRRVVVARRIRSGLRKVFRR